MEGLLRFLLIAIMGIEVVAIIFYEHKKYLSFVSPGILLSAPLYTVVLLAYFFGKNLGYISISLNTLCVFVVFMPYFVILGNCFARNKRYRLLASKKTVKQPICKDKYRKTARCAALVGLACLVFIFLYIVVLHPDLFGLLGTDKFGEELVNGVAAHVYLVALLCGMIIIGTFSKKSLATLLVLALITFYSLLLGVKYYVIILVLVGLILRIMLGLLKLRFIYCIILAVCCVLLATSVYLLEFYLAGQKITGETFVAVIRHLTKYLFSGVLAMGETMEKTIPTYNIFIMFRPLITIFNGITFKVFNIPFVGLDNNWDGWVAIGIDGGQRVNVSSLFGSIYFGNGLFGLFIVLLILASVIYYVYHLANLRQNIWLKLIYSIIVAPLVLSWFGYYYNLLTFYELSFFAFIAYVICNSRNSVKEKKRVKHNKGVLNG